ncbi:hypothetical protein GN958_ATG16146, partial [Phytophthora infestans]
QLKKQGWTSVRPRAKALDPRWNYVHPGGHASGTKGLDVFLGMEELLDFQNVFGYLFCTFSDASIPSYRCCCLNRTNTRSSPRPPAHLSAPTFFKYPTACGATIASEAHLKSVQAACYGRTEASALVLVPAAYA